MDHPSSNIGYSPVQRYNYQGRLTVSFFCIALGWGFTLLNSSNFRRRLFTSTSIRREKVCCEFVFCAFRCHTLSILYDNVEYLMQFRKPVQIQINAGENLEMHYFRRVRRSDIHMPTSVAKWLRHCINEVTLYICIYANVQPM